MPSKISAGLLSYHQTSNGSLEVLLAHYGGPLWARKDLGAWTVVKGELNDTEIKELSLREVGATKQSSDILLGTGKREFTEETGIDISSVLEFIPLGEIKQRGGKVVHAWAFQDSIDVDPRVISANPRSVFEMEWPPRSGKIQQFPEIDRAEWFSFETARQKINPAQVAFLDRLSIHLSS